MAFLSVATFFEGYDMLATAQILPNLRAEMHLDQAQAGQMLAVINIGTVLAYLLVREADRWGRRSVLSVTILGYAAFSFSSGLARGPVTFALLQLVARVFLIAEWAVATIYAAEEFPAETRGMVIGVIQGASSLGAIVCAGLVPKLVKLPWGWRSVFFVGAVPLLLAAVARRGIRETARFEGSASARREAPRSLTRILRSEHRPKVLWMALIWGLTYACTQNAVTLWKDFAVTERNMTDKQVALALTIASLVAMPLVFGSGKLLDVLGRRRGALLIFSVTSAGVVGAYTLHGGAALTAAMAASVFGVSAVLPVLNAFTTELFPTEIRSDGFAWANNLLGRIGYVLAPALAGYAAKYVGYGRAVSATAVLPLVAMGLIWWKLPETSGRELEETSGEATSKP